MSSPKLLAATVALALGLSFAACTDGANETGAGGEGAVPGIGGIGGAGGTGGAGGEGGAEGGAGGEGGGFGGEGGSGGGGAGGPACNLLDLESSGEACESCVGDALVGPCQSSAMACLQANPTVLTCSTQAGCTRIGESPPIDLVCLASSCAVELFVLNSCLMQCEAFADCFL